MEKPATRPAFFLLLCALLSAWPLKAPGVESTPVRVLSRGERWHRVEQLRFDGQAFAFTAQPGGEEKSMKAGEVLALTFPLRSEADAPLWQFAPEGWETPQGEARAQETSLRVHDASSVSHPLPEDLPRRFQFDLRLQAPPGGLSGFQWQVFQMSPNQLSPNSFTLALFGEALRLQPGGVHTQPAGYGRMERRLPAAETYRLQFFHDRETGECLLLANGEKKFAWQIEWDQVLAFTGIRYRSGGSGHAPLGIRSFEVRPWPPRAPETATLPERGDVDQLLLQNGDVITGKVLEIAGRLHMRLERGGREIRLPLENVYRVRFGK